MVLRPFFQALNLGMNFIQAVSNEGWRRIRLFKKIRKLLHSDQGFRDFLKEKLPSYLSFITTLSGKTWDLYGSGFLKEHWSMISRPIYRWYERSYSESYNQDLDKRYIIGAPVSLRW